MLSCIVTYIKKLLDFDWLRAMQLRLLFSLKPKEMAKMRLLAIWIDPR